MIAVLFARGDSVYKTFPDCDVWDEQRDARQWGGGAALVAHPPCAQWGRLRAFSNDIPEVKALAPMAVQHVQRYGGVLEHPAGSLLWGPCGLPLPGHPPDRFGGWTARIRQCDWGHRAEKLTWLYIVGVHPDDLPELPPAGEPTHAISSRRNLPETSKAEREHTPVSFARWLVETASRCTVTAPGGSRQTIGV